MNFDRLFESWIGLILADSESKIQKADQNKRSFRYHDDNCIIFWSG